MKKLLCLMLLVFSISVPTVSAIDAYKYYDSDIMVLEESVDTFSNDSSLRHLCTK